MPRRTTSPGCAWRRPRWTRRSPPTATAWTRTSPSTAPSRSPPATRSSSRRSATWASRPRRHPRHSRQRGPPCRLPRSGPHQEHRAILAAIESHDPEAARSAARLHLRHAATRLQDADEYFWTETDGLDVGLSDAP
ncbi:FCD domain-containing protein [Streptomyces bauhiniae]|uniref:FCD domain-containing protein n=1 Tax=Streptomyces bauhiniae TaxID=2340725 RepID=UPI0035DF6D0E